MDKEKALATLQEMPSDTKVKAWILQVESKFYQIATYTGYRIGDVTAVWESNKRGKRASKDPVFKISGNDQNKCADLFLDTLVAQ